jgi:uncharacterized alpha-E superfamily protein
MLSRVAERIYWLARYLERIENTARLINVHTALLMDLPEHKRMNWFTLINVFDAKDMYFDRYDTVNEHDVMSFLLADSSYSGSMVNAIFSLRENARTTLDVLPDVIWEQINELHLELKSELSSIGNRRRRQKLLLSIIERCQIVWGIVANQISRNYGYDFLQTGKYLERADMTSRILEMTSSLIADKDSGAVMEYEGLLWGNLLKSLNARQMYIQTDDSRLKARLVLGFLIGDAEFPRSISFSLDALNGFIAHLPKSDTASQTLMKYIEEIPSELAKEDVDQVQRMMDKLQLSLTELNKLIANTWFYPDYSVE